MYGCLYSHGNRTQHEFHFPPIKELSASDLNLALTTGDVGEFLSYLDDSRLIDVKESDFKEKHQCCSLICIVAV